MLKLAVWKFSSCDGCQLSLLDCEDELLLITEKIQIAYFLEASRRKMKGPYDLSLIEGSVTTSEERERALSIRKNSLLVVTIGACATAGGIQALRNFSQVNQYISQVYPRPEFIETLKESLPISHFIPVDYELRGCPISKRQLLQLISSLLVGKRPSFPTESVCAECKRKGNICVMVAHQTPCLGPVTQCGCDALCPTYRRGCYGCFGPKETPNTSSLAQWLNQESHLSPKEISHLFRSYNATSTSFQKESERWNVKPSEIYEKDKKEEDKEGKNKGGQGRPKDLKKGSGKKED